MSTAGLTTPQEEAHGCAAADAPRMPGVGIPGTDVTRLGDTTGTGIFVEHTGMPVAGPVAAMIPQTPFEAAVGCDAHMGGAAAG